MPRTPILNRLQQKNCLKVSHNTPCRRCSPAAPLSIRKRKPCSPADGWPQHGQPLFRQKRGRPRLIQLCSQALRLLGLFSLFLNSGFSLLSFLFGLTASTTLVSTLLALVPASVSPASSAAAESLSFLLHWPIVLDLLRLFGRTLVLVPSSASNLWPAIAVFRQPLLREAFLKRQSSSQPLT